MLEEEEETCSISIQSEVTDAVIDPRFIHRRRARIDYSSENDEESLWANDLIRESIG